MAVSVHILIERLYQELEIVFREELKATASYEDDHGTATREILDEQSRLTALSVDIDLEFLLDERENAADQLTDRIDAAFFCCDE